MYVDKLTIKNFRCFDRVTCDFCHPASKRASEWRLPNVNLLIGNNGTGKTTTFQALTMAVLKTILATSGAGFRTDRMIRFGESVAEVSANIFLSPQDTKTDPTDADPFTCEPGNTATASVKKQGSTEFLETRGPSPAWNANLFSNAHPGLFVAAYGAGRRTERPEAYNEVLRERRYQRIASLFEPHVGLVPFPMAYSHCTAHRRWSEVVRIVNRLLPSPVRLTENVENETEPLFDFDGVPLPVSALSDGYRLFVGWLIDFLTHLSRVLPKRYKLTDATGIVIVDEVDLFLSPTWQRTVLESLSKEFPHIQWLCSTHSALVAGSLESENICILEHTAPYTSRIRRPTEVFEGRSVETVLSELFNVNQPRSPELERQLGALARRAMAGDTDASLEYLRRLNEGTGKQ